MATAKHLLILLPCCLASLAFCHSLIDSDIEALRAFAAEISSDPTGILKSWSNGGNACNWGGVDCTWVGREFRVTGLSLQSRELQGRISPELALLSQLKHLDLSGNRLSGQIPDELASLTKLRSINFSNNQLVGQIPFSGINRALFKQAAAFAGNPGLCGRPLPNKCSSASALAAVLPNLSISRRFLAEGPGAAPAPAPAGSAQRSDNTPQAPSPSSSPAGGATTRSHHKSSKVKRWAIGAAVGVVVGSIAGVIVGGLVRVAVILYKNSRRNKGPIIFHHKIIPKHLEFLDTPEAFQDSNKIGEGGAGKVYKATLENGLTVAIKRVLIHPPPESTSGAESSSGPKPTSMGKKHTMAEMETLGKIRHSNLTCLYAYIPKPDAHLLVYQFMAGGSLQDAMRKVREGALVLDWPARRNIAIGMVKGIKYLHFDCTPKILHRDLKPSNILLDEDMEAHLSDFGLARALPDDMTHITTQVAGTLGYIAPEYAQTWKLTAASDVYSMGVVLGVLLSGKEPTDEIFKEVGMAQWMCYLVQTGQEMKGIDAKLVGAREEEGGASSVEDITEMKLAMRIACLCTKSTAAERPTSKDVLVMLNPSKKVHIRPMTELLEE